MVRTQIYLTREQHRALRRAAKQREMSMTELLRHLVDLHLLGRAPAGRHDKEAVLSFIDLGESGSMGAAENHDEALAEAFRGEAIR